MSSARAAELVTATITLTNVPAGLPTNITLNASTRSWTNDASGAPGTSIQITNTVANSATNLLNHLTDYPVDFGWYLSQTSPTNVLIRGRVGQALTITFNPSPGWAYVTYSTQTVSSPTWVVRVPITVEAETNRTNIASLLVTALSDHSTNAFATNSTAASNFLTKGASPVQAIASPVQFNGRVGIGGSLNASNGFTSSITNINPVSSNAVNHGNAFRSEGPGGNSLQLGSNAAALGPRNVVVGNGGLGSNADVVVVGTSAIGTNDGATVTGNAARVGGDQGAAFGNAAYATNSASGFGTGASAGGRYSAAFSFNANATAEYSAAFGPSTVASDYAAGALFAGAQATAIKAMALGPSALATHSNAFSIGPSAATTTTNQGVLGDISTAIYIPGVLSATLISNATTMTGSTNIGRGSWSYPAFALTTLAAGNNISVPFGTNRYIRAGAGPASAATICGIIGGATSGGLDGQVVDVFNDTGFTLTFAVNTVDPVAANRVNTPLGTDVSIADQAWASLTYDGTDARWKLNATYPIQASATNAIASLFTNGVAVSGSATNIDIVTGTNVAIRATNTAGNVQIQINAIVNTNGSLPLFINNAKPALTNMPSFDGNYLADELLFPRTNAAGTDIALSANWSFALPTDYATNTATLRIIHSITATNGPNASNVVWRASFLHSESGSTTDLRVGSFGTSYLVTNEWAACYNCTNQAAISTISFTNASALSPGGLGILKLERVSTVDTYVGAASLIGLQIDYGK